MADIEFLSMHEWMKEVEECLFNIEEDLQSEQSVTIETSASYAKLRLVYPSIDVLELEPEQRLSNIKAIDLSPLLGKTQRITERGVTSFRKRVSAFVDASNLSEVEDQPTCIFPLIRVVRVFLKAKILNAGLVLVDLPGVGDSNAARNAVAQNYIHRADHVFVISRIVRAVTDGVARELLGEYFQKRLVLTGKYNCSFVSFVATCTDDISVEETVQTFQRDYEPSKEFNDTVSRRESLLQEINILCVESAACKKQGKEISKKLKSLKPSKKRKFSAFGSSESHAEVAIKREGSPQRTSIDDYEERLRQNSAKKLEYDKKYINMNRELQKIKNDLRAACIKERNSYTQRRLCLDFEAGLKNIQRDLRQAGDTKSSEGIQESNIQAKLRVFCVSSKAFQKMNGRFKWDQSIEGFPDQQSTEIPQLQDFAYSLSTSRSGNVYDKVLEDLNLLKESAHRFVKGFVPGPDVKAFIGKDPTKQAELFLDDLRQVSCKVALFQGTLTDSRSV